MFHCDFFNPYLDFNSKIPVRLQQVSNVANVRGTDFALKLPGFSLSLLSYLGGEDFLRFTHSRLWILKRVADM